ncbi:Pfs, NB-ARC and ankyrin domain protein [Trichoderma pleuroticola]
MKRVLRLLTFGNHHDAAIDGDKRPRTPISNQNLRGNSLPQKTNAEYTVGWICAVTTEYVAAQAILDEKLAGPEKVSQANQSDYTLGRIGKHNVVIATLPLGEYGTASAATVAADMSYNFPNIRIRLMVGIGGGAPSKRNDIRLGDIVVSAPSNGRNGIFQYDYGRMIQGQPFRPTRFLDQPPMILRTAMSGLMAQYECEGHQLEKTIDIILERNPRLLRKYSRPHESSDRLYCNTFVHPSNDDSDCTKSCGDDSLIVRPRRTQDNNSLVIHYGVIASANQLMENAIIRDKMSSEYDVLCFEMEAGGLMNSFPCLVIRGICDYLDSHKNKVWQGYASMTAAAYAKDLINRISPMDSGALQSTNDSSSSQLHLREEKSYTVSAERINALRESLRFDQIEARQMTIKNAHAKTCRWLLHKSEYLDWLDTTKISEHRGFLWIKGKPGAGKSTLMKFALNSAKKTMGDKIIIYFFFNARGEELEKSTVGMYRSLLLQLLERVPELRHTLELPKLTTQPGKGYRWTTEMLTNLLDQAIQNLKESSIVCFIDALDECDENQIRNMIMFFERVGESPTAGSFRICFSSRHYPNISISKGLNLILEGQEGHTQDVISYVNCELKIGSSTLANQIRAELQEKASGVFMWVVLVVSILNKEHDRGRIYALRKRLQEIPTDLHDLFRDILTRDQEDANELLLCIQWVLFAKNPLRPEQLYFAMLSDILYEWNPNEVTASDMERFILNSSKGLTEVTKSTTPTVQFIHESIKDYLLKENGLRDIWPDIQASVHGDSHEQLKKCCLNYIVIGQAAYLEMAAALAKATSEEAQRQRQLAITSFPFLKYAVKNVLHHANEAEASGVNQAEFLKEFPLNDWIQLGNFFESYEAWRHKRNVSFLYILAEFNMGYLIRRHPDRQSFLKIENQRYGTPLFAALAMNSSESIRVLLDAYLEIDPSFREIIDRYYFDGIKENNLGRTFTFYIKSSFEYFISKGAALAAAFCFKIDDMKLDQTFNPQNYLHIAVKNGHLSILKLFLDKCAYAYHDHQALFSAAISKGDEAVTDLLLNHGAKIDGMDKNSPSPLSNAVKFGSGAAVQQLFERGADINARDNRRRKSLQYGAEPHAETTLEVLLHTGAIIDVEDKPGMTPLLLAADKANTTVVELLLDRGANINFQCSVGKTALSYAVVRSADDPVMIKLLLGRGAEVDAKYNNGRTPLSHGVSVYVHVSAIELLLERGAEVDARDNDGRTPLSYATLCPDNNSVNLKLLLERGAEVDARDNRGRTPLSHAVSHRHDNSVNLKVLLERGAEVNAKDNNGRTPLSHAASNWNDNSTVVKLLLERGAKVDDRDNNGRTPLSHAASNWNDCYVTLKLLIERGAEVDAKDNDGRTPLSHAASNWNDNSTVVKLLLQKGAEINAKDNKGKTSLSYATHGRSNLSPVAIWLLEKGAKFE